MATDAEADGRSNVAEAVNFLRTYLANGPKLLKEEIESDSGIPEWTLQRAARRIGVVRSRQGKGGPWIWGLK